MHQGNYRTRKQWEIDLENIVKTKSTQAMVSIFWEVTNPSGSGSTQCHAYQVRSWVDSLEKANYKILSVGRYN